jgi:hypothetical protein
MSFVNSSLLEAQTQKFYVTHDEMWAAVPYGDNFMVINNGQQIKQFVTLEECIDFITSKQQKKKNNRKKSEVTIEQFC